MARILIAKENKWYDELRAVAYYRESEIEKWILQHARSIFPDHFVFPFKTRVVGRTIVATKRPDLALLRRDLSAWSVVEVELAEHSLDHVLEQTRVFAEGSYNAPEIAEYAANQLRRTCGKVLSPKRLRLLFSKHAPSIIVIVDRNPAEWQEELKKAGIDFCIFEIYKNVTGQFVYRTHGQYPTVPAEEAHCRPTSIPNLMEVIGAFSFKGSVKRGLIEVAFDECLTRWRYIEEGGRQYLRLVGAANPLSPNATYSLFRDKSKRYSFERS